MVKLFMQRFFVQLLRGIHILNSIDQGIRIERNTVDTAVHQEPRKFRGIARALSAQTDLRSRVVCHVDHICNKRPDSRIVFVKQLADKRTVTIETKRQLREVI